MISSSISQRSSTAYASFSSSSVHRVSLLRIFSLATLFLGVRSQLFPAVIELSSLDGTTGFVLNGDKSGDCSGYSVSSVDDLNGDSISDLLIGAYMADPGSGREDAGKTYVVFGGSGLGSGGTLELSSLDGTNGFALIGDKSGDWSGYSVSSAGDVNGDGVSDLLIGACLADPALGREDAGKTYVVFGGSGLGSGGTLELSSLDGTTGFTLNGASADDRSGGSVSSAGDVNGDGVSDLLIGARRANPASGRDTAGKTYVVFGKSGLGSGGVLELSSLDGTAGFTLNGDKFRDRSGFSVSSVDDLNGDNVSDLLIGAYLADPTSDREDAGKTYVVFGKSGLGFGGTLELSSLDGTAGLILNGDMKDDRSGSSVSSAGDVNGDGISDLLIGARLAASASGRDTAGKTYVVFGGSSLGSGSTLELSSLDGTNGFALNGDQSGDQSGYSVSSAGDVNGDGVSDLLIGAYLADPASGREDAGKTYVVFGSSSLGFGGTLELSSLDGKTGFTLNGDKSGDWSGYFVSSAGDVNGDGVSDLLIGASKADPISGREDAGKAYVVFGRQTSSISVSTHSSSLASTESSTFSTLRQIPAISSSLTSRFPSTASVVSSASTLLHSVSGAVEPSSHSSLALPLGIAGGVCYLVSAVATAIFVFLRMTKSKESNDIALEEVHANTQSQGNEYGELPPPRTAYGDTSFANLE